MTIVKEKVPYSSDICHSNSGPSRNQHRNQRSYFSASVIGIFLLSSFLSLIYPNHLWSTYKSFCSQVLGYQSTNDSSFSKRLELLPSPQNLTIPSIWMKEFNSQSSLSNHNKDRNFLQSNFTRSDIVIIGSGITGVSFALKMVESLVSSSPDLGDRGEGLGKFRITMLEARQFCSGATGRSGGHLTSSAILSFASLSKNYAIDGAIREVKLQDRAVNGILTLIQSKGWSKFVDLNSGRNVRLYHDQNEKDEHLRQLEADRLAGVDVLKARILTKQEAIREYGLSDSVIGALKIPGNNFFPLKFVTKMYRLAESIAASTDKVKLGLFTHTPVWEIISADSYRKPDGENMWILRTPKGSIQTKYVVHATNAYTNYLLPAQDRGGVTIVPTRAQVIAVAPEPEDPNPIWKSGFSANQGFDYFFQRPNRQNSSRPPLVILGGGRNHAPPTFESGISDDTTLNKQVSQYLHKFLPDWFPGYFTKDEVRVVHEWPGILGYTKGSHPVIGQVFVNQSKIPGQYMAAGYSGHGIARAPACAEALAQIVLADMFGSNWCIPEWLPRHYLTTHQLP